MKESDELAKDCLQNGRVDRWCCDFCFQFVVTRNRSFNRPMQFRDLLFPFVESSIEQTNLTEIPAFEADQLRAKFAQELFPFDELFAKFGKLATAAQEFKALRSAEADERARCVLVCDRSILLCVHYDRPNDAALT